MREPGQSLWYQRPLDIKPKDGERTLPHFEAVDYQCTIRINGTETAITPATSPSAWQLTT